MEQHDSVELLEIFIDKTITDIDLAEDSTGSMLTIKFSNNESLVIAGDVFDIYFGVLKGTEFH